MAAHLVLVVVVYLGAHNRSGLKDEMQPLAVVPDLKWWVLR